MPERPDSFSDVSLSALLQDLRTDMRGMRSETTEGIGTLHGKFDRLDEKLEDHARELRGEIADVRNDHARTAQEVAKIVGERAGEDRVFGANGTGRYRTLPERGDIVIPTPALGVPVSVRVGSKHESWKPPAIVRWVGKSLGSTAGKAIGTVIIVPLIGFAGAFIHAAIVPVETRFVQIPVASTAPVVAVVPDATVSPVVEATAATNAPDAGVVHAAKKPTTHP